MHRNSQTDVEKEKSKKQDRENTKEICDTADDETKKWSQQDMIQMIKMKQNTDETETETEEVWENSCISLFIFLWFEFIHFFVICLVASVYSFFFWFVSCFPIPIVMD